MKLAILFLFMLFQTPSFAQTIELEQKDKVLIAAIENLQSEIVQTLKEKHGYQGTGFKLHSKLHDLDYPEANAYLKALKKIKIALKKTKFVRNFKNVGFLIYH